MIAVFSEWAKNLSLAVIVVSLLEMLLPNNKTKKYIKMTMGLYILFNIISPFLGKDISLDFSSTLETSSFSAEQQKTSNDKIDQTSMDNRLTEILEEELEKDVTKKIEEEGYEVLECKVTATLSNNLNKEESKIESIKLTLQKDENKKQENDAESKLVEEIQKIRKVQIGSQEEKEEKTNLSLAEKQTIQKFLCEEYGVNEKCLEIN